MHVWAGALAAPLLSPSHPLRASAKPTVPYSTYFRADLSLCRYGIGLMDPNQMRRCRGPAAIWPILKEPQTGRPSSQMRRDRARRGVLGDTIYHTVMTAQ